MSEKVQSRHFYASAGPLSGLLLSTDIIRPARQVGLVPRHEVAALQPAAREQEPRGRQPGERIMIAVESSGPENRGVVNLTQEGAPHERD